MTPAVTPETPKTASLAAQNPQVGRVANSHGGGAPVANRNAAKHGLRMTVSKLPPGCQYITAATYALRRLLEEWAVEHRGQVDVFEAAVIQTAVRWEAHAQLCGRWLRVGDDKLSHAERMSYSREIARASSERDRCLGILGLDRRDTDDVFATFHQVHALPNGNGVEDVQDGPRITGNGKTAEDTPNPSGS